MNQCRKCEKYSKSIAQISLKIKKIKIKNSNSKQFKFKTVLKIKNWKSIAQISLHQSKFEKLDKIALDAISKLRQCVSMRLDALGCVWMRLCNHWISENQHHATQNAQRMNQSVVLIYIGSASFTISNLTQTGFCYHFLQIQTGIYSKLLPIVENQNHSWFAVIFSTTGRNSMMFCRLWE